MNISSFSTISAIALTGLAFTLGTTNASAHDHRGTSGHGSHGSSSHCSTGRGHGHCNSLPRGCRPTRYRGERCWYGGGNYYRCAPTGGYICINAAPQVEYTTTVVQRPCVKRRVVQQVVEQPVVEEEQVVEQPVVEEQVEVADTSYDSEEVVSYLPTNCETVYVGGVRCWYSNGCYYRHCGRGYTKFHCGGRGHVSRGCHSSHVSHGCHTSSHGRTCSTAHGSHGSHGSHNTSSHGSHGSHGSHNSGGHSGHSSGHGRH